MRLYWYLMAIFLMLSSAAMAQPPAPELITEQPEDRIPAVNLSVSPELAEKLDDKQLYKLVKSAIHSKQPQPDYFLPQDVMIPMVVFFSIVAIVFISLFIPYRRTRDLQETLRAMVKENREIPESLLLSLHQQKLPTAQADLRKGILLSAVGLGASIIVFMVNPNASNDGSWTGGFLPLFIGLGYLILWFLHRRNKHA
ncbi:DUF6249 domain-containing protein [Pseudobacteriovorax antillogorgiicola]|uniref:DUF6249 domain-containing protein n=1 Tax=Pseudobacteriovorax antillogorgiicola TaxID=1513793 RepID=A0A1Y6CX25_9BACT|nr:DUF6249 domain-containing protein [Pseudobacteriovorax antillogorgiicola]TCS42224.1 hypothetical protein EDD56_14321 [Pseudobacteriovorax antillogorgiicola]SMF82757.1 hypothetical protein SAMN06296036_1436 [Pseudobacteriovorax antillogorgiicola]